MELARVTIRRAKAVERSAATKSKRFDIGYRVLMKSAQATGSL